MIKKLLYSIGLFIVFLMLLGLAINTLGKLIGVDRPLNTVVILITFWLSVLIVVMINKGRILNWFKSFKRLSIPMSVYSLILLPVMAVVGAELVNATGNNIVLMIMLPLLVVVPIICLFTKVIPQKYWAFAMWMMSLSVILHRVLISPYLVGTDNVIELAVFKSTLNNGIWGNVGASLTGYNTVLSVNILPVMVAKITFINSLWVFKLVFPLLLSVVPVAVYELVKTQFTEKISLLSAFFLMGVFTFFTITIMSEKQMIASVLLAVFLLALLDKQSWKILGLLGLGIIVSHYGTAILFVILMVGLAVLIRKKQYIILAGVFVAIGIGWYALQGNGFVVKQITLIGESVVATPVVNGSVVTSQVAVVSSSSIGNEVMRLFTKGTAYLPVHLLIMYIVSQLLIIGGVIVFIYWWVAKRVRHISLEYVYLALMMMGFLGTELIIPKMSYYIGIERIYLYCMMILIPFMFCAVYKIKKWRLVMVIFISIFFLTNLGFVNQLIGKPLSDSIALSPDQVDAPLITAKELEGTKIITDSPMYGDNFSQFIFCYEDINNFNRIVSNILLFKLVDGKPVITNNVPEGSYIYLRKSNILRNELTLHYYDINLEGTITYPMNQLGDFNNIIETSSVIYQNSDCRILQTTKGYTP